LRVDLSEFVAFLKTSFGSAIPVDFVRRETEFAPFWNEYVVHISSLVGEVDPEISDAHNAFLYHVPTVALVPRRDVFIAFVKNEDYDDIYLVYNAAAVSANRGRHLYVVPFIDDKVVDVLVANKVNPAILSETLYMLPILASIPCSNLLRDVPFIKEFMTVRMQSYITSSDVAFTLLGYALLKLLARSKSGLEQYEGVFEEVVNVIFRTLEKKVLVSRVELTTTFVEFPVDVIVVAIGRVFDAGFRNSASVKRVVRPSKLCL